MGPLDRFFDGSLAGNKEEGRFGRGLALFLCAVIGALCRLLFRLDVKNRDVVEGFLGKKNGAVLVAPHVSYLDAVFMFLACRPRQWVRIMGKADLFTCAHGLLGQVVARLGAFPINRDSADTTAIKRASRMLKNGELVGLFPEGTRRGKGNVELSLHGGAALIARMGKAPLVPVGMVNAGEIKQKGRGLRFPKVTVIFGSPYALSAFDFLPKEDRLDGATWFVMRESFALSCGCDRSQVDMRGLFPEGKDFTSVFEGVDVPTVEFAALPDYVAA